MTQQDLLDPLIGEVPGATTPDDAAQLAAAKRHFDEISGSKSHTRCYAIVVSTLKGERQQNRDVCAAGKNRLLGGLGRWQIQGQIRVRLQLPLAIGRESGIGL